jgi:hypothetical protein
MKRLTLVLSILACLGALVAAVAVAKPAKSYPTTSTLEVKAKTIAGKVDSPKAACRKNRVVHGVWLAPGAHLITEPASSDGSGTWEIDFEIVAGSKGRLSIDVAPKSLGGGVTCKGYEFAEVVVKK